MKPDDSILDLWRRVLGDVPDPDKLGQLDSLNQISPAVVAAARRLDARKAAGLISSYVRPDRRRFIERFVQDVVFGNTPPAVWSVGRTLVPDWSFKDQVTLPREALLAPVGAQVERRVVPSLRSWQDGTSWIGAPCLPQPEATYLSAVPENASALDRTAQTEALSDLTVAVRRWIAARIAAVVRRTVGTDFTEAGEAAAAFAPLSSWTQDARAALEGLVREARELGPHLEAPPGFRGPDAWFRDPSG